MKSSKPYKHICNFDVNEIKTYLPNEDNPLWFKNTFRQKLYKDHDKTLSIIFKWDSNTNNEYDKSIINEELINSNLGKAIEKIVFKITEYYPNKGLSKVILALLPKNSSIKKHMDLGPLQTKNRIHVPIITDPKCIFNIDGIDYSFKEGYCFEFDNTRSHYVDNKSNTSRVHLIVDLDIV